MALKYKAGDKVRIKSLDWYNKNIKNNGIIICGSESFTHPMSHFCDKVVTIVTIQDDCYRILEDDGDWYWTDEMIEGLVEEETKPKFKVGDKVKWHNHICNITSIDTYENTYIYLIMYDDYREDATFVKWAPESELTFEDDVETKPKYEDEVNGEYYSTPKYLVKPNGYQFVDENGNVINATKIVLEKKGKEYPKTYEECCVDLGLKVCPKVKVSIGDTPTYREHIVETFIELLACRDAYLKRYEIEMKLNSRWTPDYEDLNTTKFCITTSRDKVIKVESSVQNYVFAFPTEEMRDTFYENFKEIIEQCKELL